MCHFSIARSDAEITFVTGKSTDLGAKNVYPASSKCSNFSDSVTKKMKSKHQVNKLDFLPSFLFLNCLSNFCVHP